ncbi:FUSC family protein [Caballeronia sp. EK]|uniref:FUSC family protein n=1 Tax=Caballeronia sp. EK TaxID=2767469 RepID=UPI001655D5C2|nr:FUSC family protein [Caballeronia sp. EK]MBC8639487.1 FUSC family protein [Caballeronia sp. EK]
MRPAKSNTVALLSLANPRWPIAFRAALSLGIPLLLSWLINGDLSAGLVATLGSFTSLYASDRPYRNRALVLAGIAITFAAAVTAGVAVQGLPHAAVPLVVGIAMLASFFSASLKIGPPGAYMIVLACAAATAMPVTSLPLSHVFLLILAGGAISWLTHMAGALVAPRGPERAALVNAANATAHLLATADEPAREIARHSAALALHEMWIALVNRQPRDVPDDGTITTLRALGLELHLIFARCNCSRDGTAEQDRVRQIASLACTQTTLDTTMSRLPLGQLRAVERIARDARFGTRAWNIALRVGIAVAIAGSLGEMLGLTRAYWAMAAATLVLHQGLNLQASLRRSIDRTVGTLVGIGLAALVLVLHPTGLSLIATLMALQFIVELLVVRKYAFAVIFVTAIALTIATGGHAIKNPEALLIARGVDTLVGCAVGLLVCAASNIGGRTRSSLAAMLSLIACMRPVLGYLQTATVTSDEALRSRQSLQDEAFSVMIALDVHPEIESVVMRAQELAYLISGAAWLVQMREIEPARIQCTELQRTDTILAAILTDPPATLDESVSIELARAAESIEAWLDNETKRYSS